MRSETILLVDDNPDDVFLLEHALRSARIINSLVKLDNGLEALAYLQGTGKYSDRNRYPYPALLLLDLHLPLHSGFMVLEWLRSNPQPNLKVVVCTGTATPAEVEMAYKLGAERVLEKTPDFPGFVRQLESIPGIQLQVKDAEVELVFD